MELDRVDSGLLGAGVGTLGASTVLSGSFGDNINEVFNAVKDGIDGITNTLPGGDALTGGTLNSLGIETFGALGSAGFSVLLTFLLSSKDEKAKAIIRSLFIGGVISTSLPVLSAAFIGLLGKKLYDMKLASA